MFVFNFLWFKVLGRKIEGEWDFIGKFVKLWSWFWMGRVLWIRIWGIVVWEF